MRKSTQKIIMTPSHPLKLSICIPTFNRAAFIGCSLDSILSQTTSECEIVVSDNASTDETEKIVSGYVDRFTRVRYVRQDRNVGFDRNCDLAVEYASGEYCWLFSDDDVMKPGAISTVLEALHRGYSLVLVNGEHRDITMSDVKIPNFFAMDADMSYSAGEIDRLFTDIGTCLVCVCCVVIQRDLWIARARQQYYRSWFIHTAVVFQEAIPGNTLVIAEPLMSLRLGNHQRMDPDSFQIWKVSWPALVWSFPLAETTKKRFCSELPCNSARYLLAFRALEEYSRTDYQRWVRPVLRRSLSASFVAALVAEIPPRLAAALYSLCARTLGWPNSPYDVVGTMYPESWAAYAQEQRRKA